MYRKNVAGQFVYFVLVNATTGAALTGASVTAKKAIDGAAQASATGSITEDGNGQYHLAASQADMNGDNIGFLFMATNAVPVSVNVVTTAADPTDSVRFGLTALPNANASAAGGLPTAGTGTNQISLSSGDVTVGGYASGQAPLQPTTAGRTLDVTVTGTAGIDWGNVENQSTSVTLSGTSIASSPATLSSGERIAIADALLTRNMASVSPQPALDDRSVLNALRVLRNKKTLVSTLFTVYKEDDSSAAWSATVTLDSSATPVTAIDPA